MSIYKQDREKVIDLVANLLSKGFSYDGIARGFNCGADEVEKFITENEEVLENKVQTLKLQVELKKIENEKNIQNIVSTSLAQTTNLLLTEDQTMGSLKTAMDIAEKGATMMEEKNNTTEVVNLGNMTLSILSKGETAGVKTEVVCETYTPEETMKNLDAFTKQQEERAFSQMVDELPSADAIKVKI